MLRGRETALRMPLSDYTDLIARLGSVELYDMTTDIQQSGWLSRLRSTKFVTFVDLPRTCSAPFRLGTSRRTVR